MKTFSVSTVVHETEKTPYGLGYVPQVLTQGGHSRRNRSHYHLELLGSGARYHDPSVSTLFTERIVIIQQKVGKYYNRIQERSEKVLRS